MEVSLAPDSRAVTFLVAFRVEVRVFQTVEEVFQGGPPGGGDPGNPFGGLPAWLGGLMAQQESVRAVDLPSLPELSESEIGPLIAGDFSARPG